MRPLPLKTGSFTPTKLDASGCPRPPSTGESESETWQKRLPQTYLAHPGEPSRRQLLIAALLWSGPKAVIDADDACHFYGLATAHPDPALVRIVVPEDAPARDIGFV
jgi:hypothetical protein